MVRFGRRWRTVGLLALLVAGCQQTPTPGTGQISPPPETTPQQKQLATSLEVWNALKAEHGDHYRYQIDAASAFGPFTTTTLTVRRETVVARSYKASEFGSDGEEVVERWTEEGAAVGSHNSGAEPITLDTRYHRCRDDVLSQDPTANTIYLGFSANGVLKECSYLPKDVVSEGGGESITNLEFLSAED